MWAIFAVLSAVSAAFVTIFAKAGLSNLDPTLATIIRSVIMVSFLMFVGLIFQKYTGFKVHDLNQREWIYIVLAGIAGALSWLFYFYALHTGPASTVAAIDRMSVIIIVVLSFMLFGETFNFRAILGTILMFAGIILISFA